MKSDKAKRLKDLEVENARLKKLIADQAIDISILKEANDYLGKHRAPTRRARFPNSTSYSHPSTARSHHT